MAVELNDGSVEVLHVLLSVEAFFKIAEVELNLSDFGSVCAGFSVVVLDFLSVVLDFTLVVSNLFFGILNSPDKLCKHVSGSFDSDELVGEDVDLMFIAAIIDGWLVDVPVVNCVAEALWGNGSTVTFRGGRYSDGEGGESE